MISFNHSHALFHQIHSYSKVKLIISVEFFAGLCCGANGKLGSVPHIFEEEEHQK
jgi:hypothetical protein